MYTYTGTVNVFNGKWWLHAYPVRIQASNIEHATKLAASKAIKQARATHARMRVLGIKVLLDRT